MTNQISKKAFHKGKSLYLHGKTEESLKYFEKSLLSRPETVQSHSNLLLESNYRTDCDPGHLLQLHKDFFNQHCKHLTQLKKIHTNIPDANRRLKIAYISPDFRSHAVAFFIAPVLGSHNSKDIEIFAYYNNQQIDGITENIRKLCHHWRNIHDKSDEAVAEQIRKDGIDILIDLAGHSAFNRLPVFAFKPAPVQITWLGYPNTTGFSSIDYRLTDNATDPVNITDKYHTETLIRLPGCFLCYSPLRQCPDISVLPARHNGFITFGCLNNFSKANPGVINVWVKLLKSIPDSKLVLIYNNPNKAWIDGMIKKAKTADEIPFACIRAHINLEYAKKAFINAGLGPSRVMIRGRTPDNDQHLQLYHHIDIALDPFPYNGTTTTMEALWMGVPVIAKKGHTHISRVSSSFMECLGLSELTAKNDREYITVARKLASNKEELQKIRMNLRMMMSNSALMDVKHFTENLEKTYRQLWENWCEKKESPT